MRHGEGKTSIGCRRGMLIAAALAMAAPALGAIEPMLGRPSADIRARERIEIVGKVAASLSPALLSTASEEQIR